MILPKIFHRCKTLYGRPLSLATLWLADPLKAKSSSTFQSKTFSYAVLESIFIYFLLEVLLINFFDHK